MDLTHNAAMARTGGRRRSEFRWLVIGLAVAGAIAFLTSQPRSVDATTGAMRSLDATSAVAGLAFTALGIINRGVQARSAHHAMGMRVPLRRMIRVSAVAASGNKISKSGGLVGLSVFLGEARRQSLPMPRVAAAYAIGTFGASIAVLVLGAIVAITSGNALVIAGVALIATIAAMRLRWRRESPGLPSLLGRWAARLPERSGLDPGRTIADELRAMGRDLCRRPTRMLPVIAHAITGKLLGAATLYVVLHTQGIGLPPIAVLQVYVVTLLASSLGPLPMGLGVAEASLTGLLVARGIDGSAAMTATMVYRLFDLWVPLLAGGLFSIGLLRSRPAQPVVIGELRATPMLVPALVPAAANWRLPTVQDAAAPTVGVVSDSRWRPNAPSPSPESNWGPIHYE